MYLTRNRKKVWFIDELKQQLGDSSENDVVMAAAIDEAARRARKYGGSLVTATQNGDDYFTSAQMESALKCSDWTFLLRQKPESIELLAHGPLLDGRAEEAAAELAAHGAWRVLRVLHHLAHRRGCRAHHPRPLSHLLFSNKLDDNAPLDALLRQGLSIDDAITELLRRRACGMSSFATHCADLGVRDRLGPWHDRLVVRLLRSSASSTSPRSIAPRSPSSRRCSPAGPTTIARWPSRRRRLSAIASTAALREIPVECRCCLVVVKSAVAGAGPTPSTSPPPSSQGWQVVAAAMTSQRVGWAPGCCMAAGLMLHDLRRHRVVPVLVAGVCAGADPPFAHHVPVPLLFNWTPSLPLQGRVRRLPIGARSSAVTWWSTHSRGASWPAGLSWVAPPGLFKRVAGVAGDVVTVRGREVFVNGEPVAWPKTHTFDRRPSSPSTRRSSPRPPVRAGDQPGQLRLLRYSMSGLVRVQDVKSRVIPLL